MHNKLKLLREPWQPLRLTMDPTPPPDPREQPVRLLVIDPERATPESIAWAQEATASVADVDLAIRAEIRRHLKATLRLLVHDHGALLVRTLLEEIESEP